jgi:hypothetical protein
MDTSHYTHYILWGIVLVMLFIGGYFIYNLDNKVPFTSNYPMSPSKTPSPSESHTTGEPTVTRWKVYSNDANLFSIQVPADWKVQDYTDLPPHAATVIAFSPDALPCGTCSYVGSGYFSLRIYDQKSNPEDYATFTQEMKAIGQDAKYQSVLVGGKNGVLFGNTVAVEFDGKVYEFSLDTDKGNAKINDSKVFITIVNSFQYTGLLFNE